MQTSDLLAGVRALTDSGVSDAFFTPDNIYSWLSDAQREIINILLGIYKVKLETNPKTELPDILIPLQKVINGTATSGTVVVPSDYLHLVSMLFGGSPCFIRRYSENTSFELLNTYLQGTTAQPNVLIIGDSTGAKNFLFSPLVTALYQGVYLGIPADITSTTVGELTTVTQPTLPDQARNAMIQFAYSRALQKDQSYQEATQEYSKFLQMVQAL